jgi:peptidyl-dipeptidase A
LSTETTHYLHSVGLVEEAVGDAGMVLMQPDLLRNNAFEQSNTEADVNFLLRQALHKLVLMPYTLLVDTWRFSVYRGQTLPHQYTEHWWNLRCVKTLHDSYAV